MTKQKYSTGDIKALYRSFRALSDVSGKHVDDLIGEAQGAPHRAGTDYLSNFRSGRIAQGKAKLIHAWLIEHHRDIGQAIAPDLFPRPYADGWFGFAEQQARRGGLRVVLLDQSFDIVERAGAVGAVDATLKLNQRFCFELDYETAGTVIAFQGYKGAWHGLPLGADGQSRTCTIGAGVSLLPMADNNRPEPLIEQEDMGIHDFLFLIAPQSSIAPLPETLSKQPPSLLHADIVAHRCRVQVNA